MVKSIECKSVSRSTSAGRLLVARNEDAVAARPRFLIGMYVRRGVGCLETSTSSYWLGRE